MRYIYLLFLICFFGLRLSSQALEEEREFVKDSIAPIADPKYREDQFYAGITYNLLQQKPEGFAQNSFSTGLQFGFLRDMPINEARTYAIAIGLGYSYNNLKHNLKIENSAEGINYSVVPEGDFSKNKLVLHYIDLPIEFRWRNSDAISHKFWRIYTGFKISYLFADKSSYETGGEAPLKIRNNANLNNFVYGAYISAGYNTWNLYAYYGLNPVFKSASLNDGEKIKLNSLNLGLMFYIL